VSGRAGPAHDEGDGQGDEPTGKAAAKRHHVCASAPPEIDFSPDVRCDAIET
jgi:hypothetical protein